MTEFLREYGYETDSAYDGIEGLNMFKNNRYDLVLLDIMMPKIDGFATLELLRQTSNVAVILLTAFEEEENQIKGFDLQADDYITKPFSINLVIRKKKHRSMMIKSTSKFSYKSKKIKQNFKDEQYVFFEYSRSFKSAKKCLKWLKNGLKYVAEVANLK